MDIEQIKFFNRYTRQVETEVVYGEDYLRWTYHTHFGRMALNTMVKRAWFSKWYGWRMDRPRSRKLVQPFIADYGVRTEEFLKRPEEFVSFNDFFYRQLKPEARPIDAAPESVVFPADGRHIGFQDVSKTDGIFVKGQRFDVDSLIGDASVSAKYRQGTLVLSRLCPVDYHRFHFPAAGTPSPTRLINGPLFSVSPIALRRRVSILWENKRTLTRLETQLLGTVLLIEIGATCVGSIEQTFEADRPVSKGDEKGYFKFGGSSTITLFEPGKVRLAEDLVENSVQCRELHARMGDRMAVAV